MESLASASFRGAFWGAATGVDKGVMNISADVSQQFSFYVVISTSYMPLDPIFGGEQFDLGMIREYQKQEFPRTYAVYFFFTF